MANSNITVLIIEKNGDVREHVIKSFEETELYKKAGFKTADGFKSHTEWNIENIGTISYNISVYGKTKGRANQENKYEFPPPIDNTLFFGNCLLINKQNGKPAHLRVVDWEAIYDYLYGGFEDIGDEESDELSEDEENDVPLNKYGYAKDGFVVDDEEDIEDEYETEEELQDVEGEENDIYNNGKKKKNDKKKSVKINKKQTVKNNSETEKIEVLTTADELKLECTSELSEESYIE
jgi:hypothetical protein